MIKWNDFRGIYRFFWIKIVVEWSKNLYNLITAVQFNFGANSTVKSSLNRWDQSITDQVRISNLIVWMYLLYFTENLTNARMWHKSNIFHDILLILLIFSRFFALYRIF